MAIELDELTGLFRYVLEKDDIGADANFFASGGDSLLAVRLLARLAHQFGVELTFADFSQAPTPRALAKLIATTTCEEAHP